MKQQEEKQHVRVFEGDSESTQSADKKMQGQDAALCAQELERRRRMYESSRIVHKMKEEDRQVLKAALGI